MWAWSPVSSNEPIALRHGADRRRRLRGGVRSPSDHCIDLTNCGSGRKAHRSAESVWRQLFGSAPPVHLGYVSFKASRTAL